MAYLQTHILDMFGPVLDPIGYRLDLNTYCDQEDIPVRHWFSNREGIFGGRGAIGQYSRSWGEVFLLLSIILSLPWWYLCSIGGGNDAAILPVPSPYRAPAGALLSFDC